MYGYGRVITSCATPAKFANLSKLVSSYPVYHIGCRGREDLVNLMCDSNSMLPYPQVPNLAMLLFLAHDCNFTTVFLELQAKSSEIVVYQTNNTTKLDTLLNFVHNSLQVVRNAPNSHRNRKLKG